MVRSLLGVFAPVLSVIVCAASCADVECHDVLCVAPDGSGSGGPEAGADVVTPPPPPGCDPAAEPKDSPACVADGFGVFVDATAGDDTNPGTRAAPFRTIAAAIAARGAKPRVYVCAGTYPESVAIDDAVSIYGGFACSTWSYDGSKPTVAPGVPRYALTVTGVSDPVVVGDIAFKTTDATAPGEASIAAFVQTSPRVAFLRASFEAGLGANGRDGTDGSTATLVSVSSGSMNLGGNAAVGVAPGVIKTCTCSAGGTSTGGGGGGANGNGVAGVPAHGGAAPNDGAGAPGATSCSTGEPNGVGNSGANAPAAASAARIASLGTLDATGWNAQAGAKGTDGAPGQGGGGGGGRDASSAGGSGACGGCGGTAGTGGGGGGASVALLLLDAPVALRASTLTARTAGRGGKGGAPGAGANGGSGGIGGCGGGDGGRGGAGGAGSGGAGGISAAVLVKGTRPELDASTLTPGTAGPKGTGGNAGANDGIDGAAADIVETP